MADNESTEGRSPSSSVGANEKTEAAQSQDRSISVGRDAQGNAFVTGDNNNVQVVIYQTVQQIRAGESGQRAVQIASERTTIGPNPYMGLAAFHEEDAEKFFGREELIKQLWEDFARLHEGSRTRFLPILGPSGCGKSSLARAGLIPELAERPLPGWKDSRIAVMTPGETPLDALAAVLARVKSSGQSQDIATEESFLKKLKETDAGGKRNGLLRIAGNLPDIQSKPLVIFVDQFEEIYSLCKDIAHRTAFIENLLEAAGSSGGRVSVVVTLRTDFLGETQSHETLNRLVCSKQQNFFVPAMTVAELRRAITKPAEFAGHPLDDETVDTLIEQTKGREGALPLLQFALTRIWDGVIEGKQPSETLEEIGGVGGALAEKAQSVFDSLVEEDQKIARRVFLGLVQLGETTRDTRRRATVDSLIPAAQEQDHVMAVINQFATAGSRLISLSASNGIDVAEVTHESLFDHWDEFKKWLDTDRADLLFQHRLDDTARHWNEQGRPDGSLWRPPDLDLLRNFAEKSGDTLTPLQLDFYQYSDHAEKERVAEKQRQERTLRQRLRIAIASAAIAFTLLVCAVALGGFAIKNSNERQEEERKRLAAERDKAETEREQAVAGRKRAVAEQERLKRERDHVEAATIIASIDGLGPYPSEKEYVALRRLADSRAPVRLSFIEQLTNDKEKTSKANADRLRNRFDFVLHAVVGLDLDMRDKVKQIIYEHGKIPSEHTAVNIACSELGAELSVDEPEFNKMVAENYVSAMETEQNIPALSQLARTLVRLGSKLDSTYTRPGAAALVKRMETEQQSAALSALGDALVEVASKLDAKDARPLAAALVKRMETEKDGVALAQLGGALGGLASQLDAADVYPGAVVLVKRMESEQQSTGLFALGDALVEVASKLDAKDVQPLADALVGRMETEQDSYALSHLGSALGKLASKLDAMLVRRAATALMKRMETASGPLALTNLASALSGLTHQSEGKDIQPLFAALVRRLESEEDLGALEDLGSVLGGLASRLDAKDVQPLAVDLVNQMETEQNLDALAELGSVLGGLASRLDAKDARPLAADLVNQMETEQDLDALADLGGALVAMAGRLDAKDIRPLAAVLARRLETEEDLDALAELGSVLGGLASRLDAKDVQPLAADLVNQMEAEEDLDALAKLGGALVAMAGRLDAKDVQPLAAALAKRMESEQELEILFHLREALVALASKLDAKDIRPLAAALAKRMESEPQGARLAPLAKALVALASKLDAKDIRPLAAALAKRMESEQDRVALFPLANALVALASKLDAKDTEPLAAALVKRIKAEEQIEVLADLVRAWRGLASKLDAKDVQSGAAVLVNRIETEENHLLLSELASALSGLAGKLDAKDVQPLAAALVKRIETEPESVILTQLASASSGLAQQLNGKEVQPLAAALVKRIETEQDSDALSLLGGALDVLILRLDEQSTISILKSVVCVREMRRQVITAFGNKNGEEFDYDLWQVLDWAERQGIDVKIVPRWPLVN